MIAQHPSASALRQLEKRLRAAGLRATRQRLELGRLLFRNGHRHVTAEKLYEESLAAGLRVSLATIYNTLNQFSEAGLLRQVALNASQTYYDTNMGNHYHFYLPREQKLIDIDASKVKVRGLPKIPAGQKIASVDVMVRLEDE